MSDPTAVRTVELAYPLEHDGDRYEPDATVDLPVDQAKQLVRDGRARWPGEPTAASPQSASTKDKAAGAPAQKGVTGG